MKKIKHVFFMLVLCTISAAFSQQLSAQNSNVSGTITDEKGETIIGASVKVKGATEGTITDVNGKFSLKVATNAVLVISYVGYTSQEVALNGRTSIAVQLKEESKDLDEVVVVGYQSVRKKDLTGSVSAINGKTLTSAPVANAAQALQGKLPGVNVVSQDGRPDANVSIRVRGGGSISQSNEPLILVDGVTVSSLRDIPGNQIESINVLKDASSTAIYGARGANGVILVTTKGTKEGKISVSYDGYAKFNEPTGYLKTLSPYDFLKYVWANAAANGTAYVAPFEKLYGLGAQAGNNTGGIESYRNVEAYDLQRKVYNSSFSHNHDLSISGGNDKTKILFSAGYMDEQGMKINSFAKRATATLKISQKIFENFDFDLDTRYTDSESMGNEGTTSGSGSLLSSSYRFRPIATKDILGDIGALREGNIEQYAKATNWDNYNSYARIADYEPLTNRQALISTGSINWKMINGLTYHTDLTLSRNWSEAKTWSGATYNSYLDDITGIKLYAGNADYQKAKSWGLRWTNTLNYDLKISNSQRLNVLAGHEVTNSGGNYMRIGATYFPANFTKDNAFAMINQYDQTKGKATISSDETIPSRVLSFFGRANYSLLDKYLFTFTFRADGSSKFTPDNKWGYFPAAAFAWRASEEQFLKPLTWLDNLKLRLSYGEVGNDGISSSLWSQQWTSETDLRNQYTINGIYKSTYKYANEAMANSKLKWETTITRDFGVDFDIFKSRLSGTVDLYWNTTKDLLLKTTIPGITGFTSTYANVGQTSNKGLEFSLTGVIFKNKDWNISASANINFNKANVDALADDVNGLYSSAWAGSATQPASDYVLMKGRPVGLVRGFKYTGIYTTDDFDYVAGKYVLKTGVADLTGFMGVLHGITDKPSTQTAYPGLPKFEDKNIDGKIDNSDIDVIGDMNPVHTGGFNLNVNYKNFDLGAYFNWSYGGNIYNANKLASLSGPKEAGAYDNKLAFMANSYKIYDVVNGQLVRLTTPEQMSAANVNSTVPLAYNEGGVVSSIGIEDGSYLRLNTLILGYTIPQKLTKKIGIGNLRVYGTIYNVFTLTNYSGLDPEVSTNEKANNQDYPTPGMDWGAYPRSRSFVVGLNLSL